MVREVRDVQPLNARVERLIADGNHGTESPVVREVRDVQPLNAQSSMVVTESPVVTEVRDVQPFK